MFRDTLVQIPKPVQATASEKPVRLSKRRRLRRSQNGIDVSTIKSTWF